MKKQKGGPTRDIIRNKYGSVGTVDRTKKDGSSRSKEIEANTDGTGTVRKYKYDSKGMEKSYKTKNISAEKAERKNKRIERKAQKGGVIKKIKSKAKEVGKNIKSKLADFTDKQRAEMQSTARYKQRKSIGYYKNSNKKQYGGAAASTRPAPRTPELPPKRTRPSGAPQRTRTKTIRQGPPTMPSAMPSAMPPSRLSSIARGKSSAMRKPTAPDTYNSPYASKPSVKSKPDTNRRKERLGKRELSAYNKKMDYRKSTSDPNMRKISRNDKRLSRRQDKSIDAGVNVNYGTGSVSYKKGGPIIKGKSLRRSRKHL